MVLGWHYGSTWVVLGTPTVDWPTGAPGAFFFASFFCSVALATGPGQDHSLFDSPPPPAAGCKAEALPDGGARGMGVWWCQSSSAVASPEQEQAELLQRRRVSALFAQHRVLG